jgi:hypothetical protein
MIGYLSSKFKLERIETAAYLARSLIEIRVCFEMQGF